VSEDEARKLLESIRRDAERGGYLLNPDEDMVLTLMEGLLVNTGRYGYRACPCMEADGTRETDLDIICPCDYRDADLEEFGTCYCALYVSEEVAAGRKPLRSIPLRRPTPEERAGSKAEFARTDPGEQPGTGGLSQPVWRCQVCGYLCARPTPPLKCPVCRVDRDRFERFL
jgi:ferredoxin-thioredoxin reductase catalytic chain